MAGRRPREEWIFSELHPPTTLDTGQTDTPQARLADRLLPTTTLPLESRRWIESPTHQLLSHIVVLGRAETFGKDIPELVFRSNFD
jgi:hypothetical protein